MVLVLSGDRSMVLVLSGDRSMVLVLSRDRCCSFATLNYVGCVQG